MTKSNLFFKVLADVNEANEVHEAAADCAIALLEALEPLDPAQQPWSAQGCNSIDI